MASLDKGEAKQMLFVTALLFGASFYLLPLGCVLHAANLFPLLGGNASFFVCAALWYGLWLLIVTVLLRYHESLLEEFPTWVEKVIQRTGISGLDWFGLLSAIILLVWAAARSFLHFPLALAAIIAFGKLAVTKVEPRQLEPARVPYVPKRMLPEELTPATSQGPRRESPQPQEGVETKTYSWTYYRTGTESCPQSHNLLILIERYRRFRDKNPSRQRQPQGPDFPEFATNGITSEVLEMAKYFIEATQQYDWSHYDEISNVICFVQDFPYSLDEESVSIAEYWRYPIESLYDETGDCECKSILAAALLRALGYEVIMLLIPPHGDQPGHAAIGVTGTEGIPIQYHFLPYRGKRYFYCETTAEGWKVGEVPAEYRNADIRIYEV